MDEQLPIPSAPLARGVPAALLSALLASMLASCGAPGTAPLPERPNIVLVVLDTLRADHLDVYGYGRETAPNLRRLAEEGWRFTQARSSSTWTLPSMTSMLTGLHPARHGVRSVHDHLSQDAVTVAEILSDAGYTTAAITDGGFVAPRWGFDQGFGHYSHTTGQVWQPKDSEVIAERAIAWLKAQSREPFFLLVHTYETHQPYLNPDGFADDFLDGRSDDFTIPEESMREISETHQPGTAPWLQTAVDLYDGEIRRADHSLGRILGELEGLGLDEGTVVIVTSDHGEEFLEFGNMEHGLGKVYDVNVRVPLILRVPGQRQGLVLDTNVSGVDILPTITQLAGVEPPSVDGTSLLEIGRLEERGGPVQRSTIVEGRSSFQLLDEHRMRIDQPGRTAVADVIRGASRWFDAEAAREDRLPANARKDPLPPSLARELAQATLASLGATRGLFLRAKGTVELSAPDDRSLRLGTAWTSRGPRQPTVEEGRVVLRLDARDLRDGFVLLALEASSGADGAFELYASTTADGRPERIRVLRSEERWQEAAEDAGPHALMVDFMTPLEAAQKSLSDLERRELEALGYL